MTFTHAAERVRKGLRPKSVHSVRRTVGGPLQYEQFAAINLLKNIYSVVFITLYVLLKIVSVFKYYSKLLETCFTCIEMSQVKKRISFIAIVNCYR